MICLEHHNTCGLHMLHFLHSANGLTLVADACHTSEVEANGKQQQICVAVQGPSTGRKQHLRSHYARLHTTSSSSLLRKSDASWQVETIRMAYFKQRMCLHRKMTARSQLHLVSHAPGPTHVLTSCTHHSCVARAQTAAVVETATCAAVRSFGTGVPLSHRNHPVKLSRLLCLICTACADDRIVTSKSS